MLGRGGLRRLTAVLQQQLPEDAQLLDRVVSGKLAGPSGQTLVARFLHSPSGPQAGLWLVGSQNPALGQSKGLLGRLWRIFSSDAPKRGFERFIPRGSTTKAPKAAAEKASQKSGGSSGGSGGPKGDGDKPPIEINLPLNWIILGLGSVYVWYLVVTQGAAGGQRVHEISFQEFRTKLLAQNLVSKLEVVNNSMVKVYVKPEGVLGAEALASGNPNAGLYKFYFQIGSVDSFERKLEDAQEQLGMAVRDFVNVKYVHEVSLLHGLMEILPTLLLMGATYWLISRQMRQMPGFPGGSKFGSKNSKGGAGGFFGMGKANTGTLDKGKDKVCFKDVAGCDEAKVEIMEFVDFLKNPQKYKDLGAKIPKGALLVGPPGTGKTLLAKATAGEADVPFLSISGSDFMEMFVGVGPARVRDLFAQARSQSPSMIFIDEIDAIGRARGRGGGMGGHDERENTLNQLLVEMDGFSTTSGVVVLAGTNRPDILDKALLRPGRFDRTISIDTPDIKGREQIFKVHLAKLKLARPVDFYSERLAALTPGMAGADIANVCNEAALVAARKNKDSVDLIDFEQAIDRVIGGLEKKNKVIAPEERRTVAYHESGHAVVSWFLENAEPLLKVSIVPRGSSVLGFAQYLPNENLLLTKEQLLDRVCATLGGRAAEQVMLGKISTGAVNDLERVTSMAYAQVAVYGMNEKIGLLSYRMDREQFDKPYSQETAKMIDEEVRHFMDMAYKRTCAMVEQHRDRIESMAQELMKKEVIGLDDIERLLGKRPYESRELRNIDKYRHGSQGPPQPPQGGEGVLAPEPATPASAPDTPAPVAAATSTPTSSSEQGPKPPQPPSSSGGPPEQDGGSGPDSDGKSSGKVKRKVQPGTIVAT